MKIANHPNAVRFRRKRGETPAQMQTRKQRWRIKQGLCARCWDEQVSGKTLCAKHAAEQTAATMAMRRRRAKAGKCIECGQVPPRKGKTSCADCSKRLMANRDAYIARNPEWAKEQALRNKLDRRERLIQAHKCVDCGRRPAREGRLSCQACADTRSARYYRQRKQRGKG